MPAFRAWKNYISKQAKRGQRGQRFVTTERWDGYTLPPPCPFKQSRSSQLARRLILPLKDCQMSLQVRSVSWRQPTSQKLLVRVDVVKNKTSRDVLLPDMKVTGRINYGQIDVGTIVPKHALHDVDLTELQTPPYKPLSPLTANVWIIGQDQRLIRRPIEIVEYDPITKQYLIAGVSNDSLICFGGFTDRGQRQKSHCFIIIHIDSYILCWQLHCVEILTKALLFCHGIIRQYDRIVYHWPSIWLPKTKVLLPFYHIKSPNAWHFANHNNN